MIRRAPTDSIARGSTGRQFYFCCSIADGMCNALNVVWCPRSSAAGGALVRVGARLEFSSFAWVTGVINCAVSVLVQLRRFRTGRSMRSALVCVRASFKG